MTTPLCSVLVSPSAQVNLQELFDTYFNPEEVEYTCEGCGGKKASLRHQLARLPRCVCVSGWGVWPEGGVAVQVVSCGHVIRLVVM